MRLRVLLVLAATLAVGVAAPPAASADGDPSVSLVFDQGFAATYPTCADWADASLAVVAADDLADLRVRVEDASGAAWRDDPVPFAPGPSARVDVDVPFERDDGAPLPAGEYVVVASATDVLGRTGESRRALTLEAREDAEDPRPGVSIGSEHRDGPGWHNASVLLIAFAQDDCRVADVTLRVDGVDRPARTSVSAEGAHEVAVVARDLSGRTRALAASFGIDAVAPTVAIASPAAGELVVRGESIATAGSPAAVVVGPTVLRADALDALSGVARVTWWVDGVLVGEGASIPYAFAPGLHVVVARAEDLAGNVAATPGRQVVALG